MNISFNNLLVENLKTGKVNAIKTLLEMGQGPFIPLDYVQHPTSVIDRQNSEVATQTIWFWIHQAPIAEAVEFCWANRLERELAGMPQSARASLLSNAMEDAGHAALSSQNFAGWLVTWEQVQNYIKPCEPDSLLDRKGLLNGVKGLAIQYGDKSVPWLLAMNTSGHLVRPDVQRWFSDGSSVDEVVRKAYPELLQTLLDVGGSPKGIEGVTRKAETGLISTLTNGAGCWESSDAFGSRQLNCLKTLVAYWEEPHAYKMSPDLRNAISAVEGKNFPRDAISSLKDFVLQSSFEQVEAQSKGRRPRF